MKIASFSLSPQQVAKAEFFGAVSVLMGTLVILIAPPLASHFETRLVYFIEPALALASVGLVAAVAANQFRATNIEG